MNRTRPGMILTVALTCLVLSALSHVASAAVQSASTDGEATVYLTGAFAKPFDVAYRAILKPGTHNGSWSSISLLLIGARLPGQSVSIGLSSDPQSNRQTRPFTLVVYPDLTAHYQKWDTNCERGCLVELRGTSDRVQAYVNNIAVASWSRSDLYLKNPYIQLNGEAHGTGDVLYASLTPVRVSVNGKSIKYPTCAFTTRGIEPTGLAKIELRGTVINAPGEFVNLRTGVHGDKC